MFKHQISPLTKGGQVKVHAGKGSRVGQLRSTGNNVAPAGGTPPPSPGAGINNYAKQTPMANPAPTAPDGLGTGNWPGIGM